MTIRWMFTQDQMQGQSWQNKKNWHEKYSQFSWNDAGQTVLWLSEWKWNVSWKETTKEEFPLKIGVCNAPAGNPMIHFKSSGTKNHSIGVFAIWCIWCDKAIWFCLGNKSSQHHFHNVIALWDTKIHLTDTKTGGLIQLDQHQTKTPPLPVK